MNRELLSLIPAGVVLLVMACAASTPATPTQAPVPSPTALQLPTPAPSPTFVPATEPSPSPTVSGPDLDALGTAAAIEAATSAAASAISSSETATAQIATVTAETNLTATAEVEERFATIEAFQREAEARSTSIAATIAAAPTPTPIPTATPLPPAVQTTFQGHGTSVVGPLNLTAGLLHIEASHGGNGNFIVDLVTGHGEELLVNEIGTWSGSVIQAVHPSSFIAARPGQAWINVRADGSWTIRVKERLPHTERNFTGNGSGTAAYYFLDLRQGTVFVNATHSGQGNFIVELYGINGNAWELLFNEIGQFSGQTAHTVSAGVATIDPGLYAVAVKADGNWTLAIN